MPSGKLHHLKVLYLTTVNGQFHQRAHSMPSLPAGRTRVDVQTSQFLVIHHLEYMRVTGNEKLWPFTAQYLAYGGGISAWITAYVCHYHVTLLDLETEQLTEAQAQIAPVDIAAHRTYRTTGCQAVDNQWTSYVAGVPYLVAPGKMDEVLVIPTAMCVGEDSYAFHQPKRFAIRCLINSTVPSTPRREVLMQTS